jgi:hypothetical protein
MNRQPKGQRGWIVVMTAVVAVVMIGIAALALDMGRLFVLRTEMQNAVDAASIAAAAELKGDPGARLRAVAAARELLIHQDHFARVKQLLDETALPYLPDDHESSDIVFYCAIGSKYEPVDPTPYCAGTQLADGKILATGDTDSHYVEVRLRQHEGEERYLVDLYFLPVLNLIVNDVPGTASAAARAVAGRHFFMCNYPPLMLCDPFEASGGSFRDEMNVGELIQLKQQGANQWAPGNFSFLNPDVGPGGGAPEVAEYLADPTRTGCTPPIVYTKTGSMTNKLAMALNTRFDIYGPPSPFNRPSAPSDWPPALDVIDFPRDQTWRAIDSRFGNGDWDRTTYWNTYHAWQHGAMPAGWSAYTRWQAYQWEIANGLPSKDPLMTTDDPTYDGIPGHTPDPAPARRMLYVAILSCQALNLHGSMQAPIFAPDGFAKIFVSEHAAGPPDSEFYGEYQGWASDEDADYHVDIQLYE